MTELDNEVRRWMDKLGFQDNTTAKIPNYQFSLRQFMDPNPIIQEVAKDSREWDPLDDGSFITPELAKVFYLAYKKGLWDDKKAH